MERLSTTHNEEWKIQYLYILLTGILLQTFLQETDFLMSYGFDDQTKQIIQKISINFLLVCKSLLFAIKDFKKPLPKFSFKVLLSLYVLLLHFCIITVFKLCYKAKKQGDNSEESYFFFLGMMMPQYKLSQNSMHGSPASSNYQQTTISHSPSRYISSFQCNSFGL